jgi:hypothetical protein
VLKRVDRAVLFLLDHEKVEHPNNIAIDEIPNCRCDLAGELEPGNSTT